MKEIQFKQSWRKPYQWHNNPDELPDECQPDQSYTIREILNQFTSGLTPQLNEYDDYDGDNPDFDNIDELLQYDDISDVKAAELATLENYYKMKRKQAELSEFVKSGHLSFLQDKVKPQSKENKKEKAMSESEAEA